jgi:hypothetical protein
MRLRTFFIFSLILSLSACGSHGSSALSDALATAVKEKRLSVKKKEFILTEYQKLRDEDKVKAREYVDQIVSAVKMGGDSSHIDAARMQVIRSSKFKVQSLRRNEQAPSEHAFKVQWSGTTNQPRNVLG